MYVSLYKNPKLTILVSIVIVMFVSMVKLFYQSSETMALVNGNEMGYMEGVPKYVYSSCGMPDTPCDPVDNNRCIYDKQFHDQMMTDTYLPQSTLSNVSDPEIMSLCNHIKKDKNATNEIMNSEFSELMNTPEACNFAKHQYEMKITDVPCTSPETIASNRPLFPTTGSSPLLDY